MQVGNVTTREGEVIRANASIEQAAEKTGALDAGPLPVCDGDRLAGMA
jgi:hypothetical protein